LPALFLFTDPARTPDPVAAARALPPGSGVVYRHFGEEGADAIASSLTAACRDQGHVLLIAADPELAARVNADGVHWPERRLAQARRSGRRGWMTASAHSPRAVARAARSGADAVFLSPVFRSASPSAGAPLGPLRARIAALAAPLPVYALGGIKKETARRLLCSQLSGLAAIEALV